MRQMRHTTGLTQPNAVCEGCVRFLLLANSLRFIWRLPGHYAP
jgi:hypothetical protein